MLKFTVFAGTAENTDRYGCQFLQSFLFRKTDIFAVHQIQKTGFIIDKVSMPGTVDIKDTGKALPGDKGLEFADDFCLQQSELNDILIKNNFW